MLMLHNVEHKAMLPWGAPASLHHLPSAIAISDELMVRAGTAVLPSNCSFIFPRHLGDMQESEFVVGNMVFRGHPCNPESS